jgi:hypothetical protein
MLVRGLIRDFASPSYDFIRMFNIISVNHQANCASNWISMIISWLGASQKPENIL